MPESVPACARSSPEAVSTPAEHADPVWRAAHRQIVLGRAGVRLQGHARRKTGPGCGEHGWVGRSIQEHSKNTRWMCSWLESKHSEDMKEWLGPAIVRAFDGVLVEQEHQLDAAARGQRDLPLMESATATGTSWGPIGPATSLVAGTN